MLHAAELNRNLSQSLVPPPLPPFEPLLSMSSMMAAWWSGQWWVAVCSLCCAQPQNRRPTDHVERAPVVDEKTEETADMLARDATSGRSATYTGCWVATVAAPHAAHAMSAAIVAVPLFAGASS